MATNEDGKPSFFARYIADPEEEKERLEPEKILMGRDTVRQWMRLCIDSNTISMPHGAHIGLGQRILRKDTRASYMLACKEQQVRPADDNTFGKECTKMFGTKQRVTQTDRGWKSGQYRPYAYDVPTAEAWQKRLDALLGIRKTPKAENNTDRPGQGTVNTTPRPTAI
jgi:hypothetical protein